MKTFKSIFVGLAIVAGISSCTFLDTVPQDNYVAENYYRTAEEINYALNGVYCTLSSTSLYGGCILGRMGLSADIGYEDYGNDEGTVGYNNSLPQDVMITNYWKTCYAGIGNANKLLENIDNAEMDDDLRDVAKAETRFLRAYFYFMLTKRFGDVPLITSTPKSCSLEELQIARTPQKDVYQWILDEMQLAADRVLPASYLTGGGRVSQSAVYGIMARVCLNMAGYPVYDLTKYALAKECCEKVINLKFHALNPVYKQVFINYMQKRYDIKESIWEVEFYGNNIGTYTTTAGQVGRNNGIKVTTTSPYADSIGVSIGSVRSNPYFFEMFETHDITVDVDGVPTNFTVARDQRRDWTIGHYVYKNSTNADGSISTVKYKEDGKHWDNYSGKFRREYETLYPRSQTYSPTNLPLLRYSDILLMYAEAVACDAASSGDLDKAYEYVNQVRRRGYYDKASHDLFDERYIFNDAEPKNPAIYTNPKYQAAIYDGTDKYIFIPDPEVDLPVSDAATLLAKIKDERALELGHEFLRKDDVTRWNIFMDQMKYVKTLIDLMPTSYTSSYYKSARSFYGDVTARDVLWPIPSHDISVNRKLVQNPGW